MSVDTVAALEATSHERCMLHEFVGNVIIDDNLCRNERLQGEKGLCVPLMPLRSVGKGDVLSKGRCGLP